jgi:hypothetical protein
MPASTVLAQCSSEQKRPPCFHGKLTSSPRLSRPSPDPVLPVRQLLQPGRRTRRAANGGECLPGPALHIAMLNAFNPNVPGSGFAPAHLAILALWGPPGWPLQPGSSGGPRSATCNQARARPMTATPGIRHPPAATSGHLARADRRSAATAVQIPGRSLPDRHSIRSHRREELPPGSRGLCAAHNLRSGEPGVWRHGRDYLTDNTA